MTIARNERRRTQTLLVYVIAFFACETLALLAGFGAINYSPWAGCTALGGLALGFLIELSLSRLYAPYSLRLVLRPIFDAWLYLLPPLFATAGIISSLAPWASIVTFIALMFRVRYWAVKVPSTQTLDYKQEN